MEDSVKQERESIQYLELDAELWKTLDGLSTEDVCRRSLASYDVNLRCYEVRVLNESYRVFPRKMAIRKADERKVPISIELRLLILQYLIEAKELPPMGKWVTEKELKNGGMFYRGVHSLEMFKNPLEEKFGRRLDDFLEAGLSIGGVKVNYGDVGLTFQALPRIPILCILWTPDDEFPARVNFLFDPTIEHHLALDTIWGLVREITFKLLEF
ncbi:MAG: DUF3786 domain-containing protein [Proteobacteria bacterium]|nr:DUF3786 domain-containing protein [Pseudomonadota bacterium]